MVLRTFLSLLLLGAFFASVERQNAAQLDKDHLAAAVTVKMPTATIELPDTPSTLIDNPDSSEYVLIYPNPSPGYLFVDFRLAEIKNIYISIYDKTGRIVLKIFKPATLSQKYKLDLGDLQAGNYFMRFNSESKQMVVRFSIYQ